ncbi:MAG: polyphosphate polymerase domain-containing protein [Pirellulaceae bacterium]
MITRTVDSTFPIPQFRIVDWGSTRSDLATRKEIKFTFLDADVGKLRSLFETNCRRLIHNEPISTVRSIYFDDATLSACRANLDGLGQRRKVRLRWYDTLRPGTTFFFEIKWRRNRVTGKHRLQLESELPLGELTYRQIAAGLQQVIPTEHLGDVFWYCEPAIIVQYQREHFASDDGCLRVTLDYDMTYYNQMGKERISTVFPRRQERLVVVEGKTPIGREVELRQLFYPLSARVSRCSKYVHGCHLLGLIPDVACV